MFNGYLTHVGECGTQLFDRNFETSALQSFAIGISAASRRSRISVYPIVFILAFLLTRYLSHFANA